MSGMWKPGTAPVAVVMISLNEGHNLEESLKILKGWAQQVFLVDSFSSDQTIDIALRHGVHVVQRRFRGFGDQWNFALENLPITAPWTMKIDPDERLTDSLKSEIERMTRSQEFDAFEVPIRLYFMGKKLPNSLRTTRLWRTGTVRFSNVDANEHALTNGRVGELSSEILHMDSPHLEHWIVKQNRYTTAEAISQVRGARLSVEPRIFGSPLERRMWLKKNFWKIPLRYTLLFVYHLVVLGAWRAGRVGWIWAHLRTEVYRVWEYKVFEIERTGCMPISVPSHPGFPDERVQLYD